MLLIMCVFYLILNSFYYVVFIIQEIVEEIENTETGANDRPVKDVVIVDCGKLDIEPFNIDKEQ